METVYTSLTERAIQVHAAQTHNSLNARTVIALAGPPGSGKSTIAAEVVKRINASLAFPIAAVCPMDGFHYPRSYLSAMPNAAEAHARRGAHWTFDAEGVLALVRELHASRLDRRATTISAPGFDHKFGDPTAEGATVTPATEIVILEGNWLLLDRAPWRGIAALVDDTWFVDVDRGVARERIAARHLRAGIEKTREAALERVDGNDLINGDEIRGCLVKPSVVVQSVDE